MENFLKVNIAILQIIPVLVRADYTKTHGDKTEATFSIISKYTKSSPRCALLASDMAIWFSFLVPTATSCFFWSFKLGLTLNCSFPSVFCFCFPYICCQSYSLPPTQLPSQNPGVIMGSSLSISVQVSQSYTLCILVSKLILPSPLHPFCHHYGSCRHPNWSP